MVRFISRPILFAALLAVAPLGVRAATETPPECQKLNHSSTCDEHEKCINAKFKAVLEKDPEVVCENNAKAGWDTAVAGQMKDGGASCDTSVCKGTYIRLKKAVEDYKSAMRDACSAQDSAKNCSNQPYLNQTTALSCVKQVTDTNAALNQKARAALRSAMEESKSYKELIQTVNEKYTADRTRIMQAEASAKSSGEDPAKIVEEKRKSSTVTGSKFGNSTDIAAQIGGAQVDARNGGVNNIEAYQALLNDKTGKLVTEQRNAAATIDAFQEAASSEITGRNTTSSKLKSNSAAEAFFAGNQPTAGATVTGGNPTTGGIPDKSPDSGGGNTNLLNQATGLSQLAGAGAGLAAATGALNNSGASSPSAASLAGLNGPGGSVASSLPSSGQNSSFGNGAPSPGGSLGSPGAPDSGGKSPSRGDQIDRYSGVDGSSGSGGSPRGSDVGSDLSAGRGAYMSARGTASGGSGDGASIKEAGRDPASTAAGAKNCFGRDCGAMGELKTNQFNAVGALGMPKIGAADPALSTKGALDNLFGPLPSLDSLLPKDPGAAPALEGVLEKMDLPLPPGGGPGAGPEAQAAAAVAPANTRSLFERVHSVHEVALRRGSVALFHKKL